MPLALCAFGFAGCGSLFPSAELHYKLAVDIDVDGVIPHGEGVYRVDFQSQGPLLISGTPQWDIGVRGKPFAVDLGRRGIMFVSMQDDPDRRHIEHYNYKLASATAGREALGTYFDFFVNDLPNGREAQAKIEAFANSPTTVDVPLRALPMLLRFTNIDDPQSVARVDPNNLAASFGPGVEIRRATASITHDEITT